MLILHWFSAICWRFIYSVLVDVEQENVTAIDGNHWQRLTRVVHAFVPKHIGKAFVEPEE